MKGVKKLSVLFVLICAAAMMAISLTACNSEGGSYKPEMKSPELEPPAISEAGILKVGVDTSNSPLAGVSGEKIIGIDVDVAGAIGDILGLEIDMRDVGTDSKTAIESGNVDIVLGVDSDTTERGMWLSSEYIPTGIVIFALESNDAGTPKAGDSVKIGAQISSKSAWAITNSFGEKCLVSETDLASAFQALEAGEVDYVASDAIVGLYAANRQNVPVKMVSVIGATSGYCIMANKDDKDLTSAISDAVSQIVDDGVMNVIERKWLNGDIDFNDLPKLASKKGNTDNTSN